MGVAKAGFGGGIGIIATPLLALTMPVSDAAALMLPLLIACDVFAVRHYYSNFDGKSVKRLLPGALLGIGAGAFFFGYFSQHERVLEVGLGVLALLFVLFQLGRSFVLGAAEKRSSRCIGRRSNGHYIGFYLYYCSRRSTAGRSLFIATAVAAHPFCRHDGGLFRDDQSYQSATLLGARSLSTRYFQDDAALGASGICGG